MLLFVSPYINNKTTMDQSILILGFGCKRKSLKWG